MGPSRPVKALPSGAISPNRLGGPPSVVIDGGGASGAGDCGRRSPKPEWHGAQPGGDVIEQGPQRTVQ